MYKHAEYDYSFYEIYKTVNYVIKFFKFCELRSKWFILAGSSRTPSVCVCTYHQSIELLLDPFKLSYSDFFSIIFCGKATKLKQYLETVCCDVLEADEVELKQGTTIDRATFKTQQQCVEDKKMCSDT